MTDDDKQKEIGRLAQDRYLYSVTSRGISDDIRYETGAVRDALISEKQDYDRRVEEIDRKIDELKRS